jgi:hypothetical protein
MMIAEKQVYTTPNMRLSATFLNWQRSVNNQVQIMIATMSVHSRRDHIPSHFDDKPSQQSEEGARGGHVLRHDECACEGERPEEGEGDSPEVAAEDEALSVSIGLIGR